MLFATSCTSQKENTVVNVYNWGEYIDPTVNKLFEKETGIKVNYKTFDNNETMYAKLKNSPGTYDVIIPSDYMISRLITEDMLEKIDFDNIPNFKYIMDEYKNLEYDPTNEYSVPYTCGTVGLLYNKKYVTEKPDSWNILWDEKYSQKILMYNNSRDTMAIALLKNGFSLNTTNKSELDKAASDLKAQKKLVQSYVSDEIFDIMESESAYLAPCYAGDIINMMSNNENLDFVIPKEGTNRFVDAMCIPKGSKNKLAAEKYINFMCRKDIAELNRQETSYSTPQGQTFEELDEDIKNVEIAYPSKETLEKCTVFIGLDKETLEYYAKLWGELKE